MSNPAKSLAPLTIPRGPRKDAPTLLAVAHGSRNPAARETVEALLAEIHRQRPDLTAIGCYLDHTEPLVRDVLRTLAEPAVAVPLLLTAAFHTGVDLPRQLAASPVPVEQAAALGPHPLLLRALERRLAEAGVPAGEHDTAVVLAAAGSSDPRAVESVAELARTWAADGWWDVTPAYASAAAPSPADAVAALRRRGAPRVVVASYLLSPGLFADVCHGAGADVVSAPLGDAPEVAAVVLARYDDAGARLVVEAAPSRR
jgi:sirohydrochlorin ferrochelatase